MLLKTRGSKQQSAEADIEAENYFSAHDEALHRQLPLLLLQGILRRNLETSQNLVRGRRRPDQEGHLLDRTVLSNRGNSTS